MTTQHCPFCNTYHPLSRFEDTSGKNKRKKCKSCRNADKKKLDCRSGTGLRRYLLWTKYKMTEEQYLDMLKLQDGTCKICKGPDNGPWGKLAVDHCHKSGKIRGLLCAKCNKGLGQFNDNPQLMEEAIRYLTEHLP